MGLNTQVDTQVDMDVDLDMDVAVDMAVEVDESETGIVRWTKEEWRELSRESLDRLGVTYEELEAQSREGHYETAEHFKLWMMIGGTL